MLHEKDNTEMLQDTRIMPVTAWYLNILLNMMIIHILEYLLSSYPRTIGSSLVWISFSFCIKGKKKNNNFVLRKNQILIRFFLLTWISDWDSPPKVFVSAFNQTWNWNVRRSWHRAEARQPEAHARFSLRLSSSFRWQESSRLWPRLLLWVVCFLVFKFSIAEWVIFLVCACAMCLCHVLVPCASQDWPVSIGVP